MEKDASGAIHTEYVFEIFLFFLWVIWQWKEKEIKASRCDF